MFVKEKSLEDCVIRSPQPASCHFRARIWPGSARVALVDYQTSTNGGKDLVDARKRRPHTQFQRQIRLARAAAASPEPPRRRSFFLNTRAEGPQGTGFDHMAT